MELRIKAPRVAIAYSRVRQTGADAGGEDADTKFVHTQCKLQAVKLANAAPSSPARLRTAQQVFTTIARNSRLQMDVARQRYYKGI